MSNDHEPKPVTAANWTRRILLGCLALPVGLLLLCVLGLFGWYQIEVGRAKRQLAAETKYVRDRGSPLTTIDLDNFYRAAKDKEDITSQLVEVLALAEDPRLKEQAKDLPIVGKGAEPPPPGTDWPQLAASENYLALHEPMLELFATLPEREFTVRYPSDLSLGVHALLPDVQRLRHGARILKLQVHVDLHRGRPAAAAHRILEILALAETLRDEPIIVSQLVRSAVNGVAVITLQHTLQHADLSEADLIRLQKALRVYDAKQAWLCAIQGERASSYTITTWPAHKLTKAMSRDEIERYAEQPPARLFDAVMMLQLFHKLEEGSDESIQQAIANARAVETDIKKLAGSKSPRRFLYIQTLLMMPAVSVGSEAFAQNGAAEQAADAGLAAIRFRRANARWPTKLDELVPTFLPAVPIDPFDSKPLRFIATDKEFKVYCIGRDQVDDGGDLSDPQPKDRGFIATWRGVQDP